MGTDRHRPATKKTRDAAVRAAFVYLKKLYAGEWERISNDVRATYPDLNPMRRHDKACQVLRRHHEFRYQQALRGALDEIREQQGWQDGRADRKRA